MKEITKENKTLNHTKTLMHSSPKKVACSNKKRRRRRKEEGGSNGEEEIVGRLTSGVINSMGWHQD